MKVIGLWLFYDENKVIIHGACDWAYAGLKGGDQEWGLQKGDKVCAVGAAAAGRGQQGDLAVNPNLPETLVSKVLSHQR